MAIKPILKMGDPRLLKPCSDITEFDSSELNQLIQDLLDTMQAANGAGLAAPQIGINLNVVIFGVEKNERYPDVEQVFQTILINPNIEYLTDETQEYWEGCLSIPGMRGKVERPAKIRYTGFDQNGQEIDRIAEGFHAIVVQHECDHLNGILYPMRMTDMSQFGFESELTKEK